MEKDNHIYIKSIENEIRLLIELLKVSPDQVLLNRAQLLQEIISKPLNVG